MIRWDETEVAKSDGDETTRAAQYVRMSTEHQQYSTDNQALTIKKYADRHGYEIVKTYADEGKSGLNLKGRDALQELLSDVEAGEQKFAVVLVYDVSRWGRFQDPDEAASIELRCKRAGVSVHYCAEQFRNDGSMGSAIIKTVKRAMAGEYSRELSVKVFAGQCNLVRLGFRQGGAAGYGLRRMVIDASGNPRMVLERGEQKSIATDRVILVPGPESEIEIVQEIYAHFVEGHLTERQIAYLLNSRGVLTDLGKPWTRGAVHQVLINEKYIGNNVWGRSSFKLKQQRVENRPEDWIRNDGAFDAIVEADMFYRANEIISSRSRRLSDEEMLETLRRIYERNGQLSGLIIDEEERCPSSNCFRSRFGSLLRAYSLVGFNPDHDYRYLEINRALRSLHPTVVADIVENLRIAGGVVERDAATDLLSINGEFTASIVIVRCRQTAAGSLRWKLRLDNALSPDITVAARMDITNSVPRDYYLLPRLDMRQAMLRLCEYNGLSLDSYRFDNLDGLTQMARRMPLRKAA